MEELQEKLEELEELLEIKEDWTLIEKDSNSVFQSMKGRLDATKRRRWSKSNGPTISRVPIQIREVNPCAYEPVVVSLGPYHRVKKSQLAEMEELKWDYYLKNFLSRNPEKQLQDYITEVRGLEKRARSAYFEDLKMNSRDFTEMMLLDGIYALEIMLDDRYLGIRIENQEHWARNDLLLLENQLPFFVLQTLFNLSHPSPTRNLCKLAMDMVKDISCFLLPEGIDFKNIEAHNIKHLLHLLYMLVIEQVEKDDLPILLNSSITIFFQPGFNKMRVMMQRIRVFVTKMKSFFRAKLAFFYNKATNLESDQAVNPVITSATKLKDAGVTFKRKKNAKRIFDITFKNGVIEIPKLHFYDSTSSLLLNLIAFEQSFEEKRDYMASYAYFMDFLIDTTDDVALLQENDIIYNFVGNNEEIVRFINKTCKGILIDTNNPYLGSVHEAVVKYTNKRRNRWRAKLKQDYFSNPWAFLSLLAAVALLLLTVTQTIFSVLAYFKPPPQH